MEPFAIAKALHALVAWGLTPARVQQQELLLNLLPVRRRALQRFGHAGQEECVQASMQLIIEVVAAQPMHIREAAQELLWITHEGLRPRHPIPSTEKRRSNAIAILAQGGYFEGSAVPNPESWRRDPEVAFFADIANALLKSGRLESSATMPHPEVGMGHLPPTNPNLDYDLVLVEADFELLDEQRGRSTIRRTVQARTDGVINYEIGAAARDATIDQLEIAGAEIDHRVPGDALGERRLLLRFPAPLNEGETHTFQVTQEVTDEVDGLGYYYHVAGRNSAHELYMRILFPPDNPPDEVSRVITDVNALRRGGTVRAHAVEGREARTSFKDLQPGRAYGFRFHWHRPHHHPEE